MSRILLAEDDLLLGDGLRAGLAQRGFEVVWVRDAASVDAHLGDGDFAAAVVDVAARRREALAIVAMARKAHATLPVLVLTTRDAIPERLDALSAGANDYVHKPVDLDALAARLGELVRQSGVAVSRLLRARDIELDPQNRGVHRNGVRVKLSGREFDVLHALMMNIGSVLTRDQLEQHLYGWGQEIESNAVEVHVHHLRRKLGSDLIRTVRGVGYSIKD